MFIISTLAIVYVLMCGYLYFMQVPFIFPGAFSDKTTISEPITLKQNLKKLTLTTNDGKQLEGVVSQNNSDTLLLYYGGNSENAISFINMMSENNIVDVATFNYRGYVNSQGSPTAKKVLSDALEIYDYFKPKYKNIILLGRSLGTGISLYVASKKEVKGTILITPYDSISSVAQKQYIIFPVKALLDNNINSLEFVKSINTPISILIVKDDKVIPNKHTDILKKEIKNLTLFRIIDNTTHNDVINTMEFMEFVDKSIKDLL